MHKCKDCKWWRKSRGGNGGCHRHAPSVRLLVTMNEYLEHYGLWPQVHEDDFCGDFEAKDESID